MRNVALDLLRFFAAISVVLYHYISRPECHSLPLLSELTKYGYLGVPLFFLISGYAISLSANNRTAFQFAISRFVRLYPTFLACVLFTVLILIVFTDKQYSVQQVLANLTMLNDYLGFENVDGVYWTLKHELKFYACVFLLLAFGVFQKHHIWLTLWLGMTFIHAVYGIPFFMGWFITPEYSSFFISGIAFYLIQKYGRGKFNHFILFSSLIISSFLAYNQADGFMDNPIVTEKLTSVAVIWFFYFIIYFLCIEKIKLRERNICIALGSLTYPLYLVHNMAGKAIIDHYKKVIPEGIIIIIVLIVMILLSSVVHLIIEKPLAAQMKYYLLSLFDQKNQSSRRPSPVAERSEICEKLEQAAGGAGG